MRPEADEISRFKGTVGAILAVIVAVQLVLGGLSLKLTSENGDLLDRIQSTRKQLISENCDAQNSRNVSAVGKLTDEIGELPLGKRREAEASESYTVGLIDALVPVRDCVQVLHKAGF